MPGSWETQFPWTRRAIHMIHLRSGKFMTWADNPTGTPITIWTPGATNPFQDFMASTFFLHCAGHCAFADGRIMVAGGDFTSQGLARKHVGRFDPMATTLGLETLADMHERRWYPTCTTLPNGRIAAFAGWVSTGPVVDADIPEVYDPATDTWEQKTSAQRVQDPYPFMFVMPDGRLFDAGPQNDTRFLDLDTWQWGSPIDSLISSLRNSSAVMFDGDKGKILKAGGVPVPENEAISSAVVFRGTGDPVWEAVGDMVIARQNHNLVCLPDGKVLAVGGCHYDVPEGKPPNENYGQVMRAETFDPATNSWTADPENVVMSTPRWYHSTASLMRDGRVIAAGGNNLAGWNCENAQIYRPAYLYGNPNRPVIENPPTEMVYGQEYSFGFIHEVGRQITRATLTRLASVTHGFDQDQRCVPLKITVSNGQVHAIAPESAGVAPPGYYLLWILDDLGVPCSEAAYVRIHA